MRSNNVFRTLMAGSIATMMAMAAFSLSASDGGDAGGSGAATADAAGKPLDIAKATPKGQLKNPYQDSDKTVVDEGRKLYMRASCNGCHGGSGGGGMCPPLSNETWVYGGDDDTLFRLIAEGSDALQKDGYSRKGRENVVGPMPPHGAIVKTGDDMWKIITFIRANYRGSEAKKYGGEGAAK